jgi:hypothetical protein
MFLRCILPPSLGPDDDGVCTSEKSVYFNETTWRYIPFSDRVFESEYNL